MQLISRAFGTVLFSYHDAPPAARHCAPRHAPAAAATLRRRRGRTSTHHHRNTRRDARVVGHADRPVTPFGGPADSTSLARRRPRGDGERRLPVEGRAGGMGGTTSAAGVPRPAPRAWPPPPPDLGPLAHGNFNVSPGVRFRRPPTGPFFRLFRLFGDHFGTNLCPRTSFTRKRT